MLNIIYSGRVICSWLFNNVYRIWEEAHSNCRKEEIWKGPKPPSPTVLQTEGLLCATHFKCHLSASHKLWAISTTLTLWERKMDVETEHVMAPDLTAGGWVVGLGIQSPHSLVLGSNCLWRRQAAQVCSSTTSSLKTQQSQNWQN